MLCAQALNHVQFFVAPWTVACQAPLSMESSRQEYGSGFPFPILGDLPNPGIEPVSLTFPTLQAGSLPLVPPAEPGAILQRQNIFPLPLPHLTVLEKKGSKASSQSPPEIVPVT